jgi:AP2-associated kinase
MYRPPEMCDPYKYYQICTKVDIWMLGCVLYTIMFFKHPFVTSSKVSILNAKFHWPDNVQYSKKL